MNWLIRTLKDLHDIKFFGKITITFNNGFPVHVEKYVSMKPPEGVI